MTRIALTLIAASLVAAPVSAAGLPGGDGPIKTLQRGQYVCELPDMTARTRGIVQPAEGFAIISGSRYRSPQGGGTYLREGDMVMMTSGPRNGVRYKVISEHFLRKMVNGKPSRLRCILQLH